MHRACSRINGGLGGRAPSLAGRSILVQPVRMDSLSPEAGAGGDMKWRDWQIQDQLRRYTQMLAEIARVEDLTALADLTDPSSSG